MYSMWQSLEILWMSFFPITFDSVVLEVINNSCSSCMHANSCQSYRTLCKPMECSPQVPLIMGFSRQEYWSGLPRSPPRDLPGPWIEPTSLKSLALAGIRPGGFQALTRRRQWGKGERTQDSEIEEAWTSISSLSLTTWVILKTLFHFELHLKIGKIRFVP